MKDIIQALANPSDTPAMGVPNAIIEREVLGLYIVKHCRINPTRTKQLPHVEQATNLMPTSSYTWACSSVTKPNGVTDWIFAIGLKQLRIGSDPTTSLVNRITQAVAPTKLAKHPVGSVYLLPWDEDVAAGAGDLNELCHNSKVMMLDNIYSKLLAAGAADKTRFAYDSLVGEIAVHLERTLGYLAGLDIVDEPLQFCAADIVGTTIDVPTTRDALAEFLQACSDEKLLAELHA